MAEININDYVRDRDGFIVKVNEIQEYKEEDDIWYEEKTLKGTWKSMIVKHSKNIIDLIEVGDYVNGKRAFETENRINDNGEKVVLTENYDEWTDDGVIANKDIETILTKEQYEANCYKVKEE